MKEKLEKLNGFAEVESNDRRRKNNDKRSEDRQHIKDNAKKAEEKLRSKKKLTTEDIIAMQGIEDTEEF